MRLFDNTRISSYKTCPRQFLFRHVLHWNPQGTKLALIFGGAWHAAMDVIWSNIKVMDKASLAGAAYAAFLDHWCKEGMPHPDEMDYDMVKDISPRTPHQAMEMIVAYIDTRARTASDFELLHVERPFAVPIDPNDHTLFYVGKIDKIVKRRNKVLAIEHKTTTAYKKDGPFRSQFLDSFSPNSQVDGYLYTLHMMFPGQVGGVWVDAALVHKQEEGFTFIPIERQLQHLDTWLWEVRWWIKQIESQLVEYKEATPNHPYLKAFPKNTNSCFNFNTACPYISICKAWPNPKGKDIPPGFNKDIWNPLEHIKGLENKGFTDEISGVDDASN